LQSNDTGLLIHTNAVESRSLWYKDSHISLQ